MVQNSVKVFSEIPEPVFNTFKSLSWYLWCYGITACSFCLEQKMFCWCKDLQKIVIIVFLLFTSFNSITTVTGLRTIMMKDDRVSAITNAIGNQTLWCKSSVMLPGQVLINLSYKVKETGLYKVLNIFFHTNKGLD